MTVLMCPVRTVTRLSLWLRAALCGFSSINSLYESSLVITILRHVDIFSRQTARIMSRPMH